MTTRALQDDPDNSDLYTQRGIALLGQEKEHEAISAFDELLRIDPEDPWGHYWRGLTYKSFGKLGKAEVEFARAKELDPDFDTSIGDESDEGDED